MRQPRPNVRKMPTIFERPARGGGGGAEELERERKRKKAEARKEMISYVYKFLSKSEKEDLVVGTIVSLPSICWVPPGKFVDPRFPKELYDGRNILLMVTHIGEDFGRVAWVNVVIVHFFPDVNHKHERFPHDGGLRSIYFHTRLDQLPSQDWNLSEFSSPDRSLFRFIAGVINYTMDVNVLQIRSLVEKRIYQPDMSEPYDLMISIDEDWTVDHRKEFPNWRQMMVEAEQEFKTMRVQRLLKPAPRSSSSHGSWGDELDGNKDWGRSSTTVKVKKLDGGKVKEPCQEELKFPDSGNKGLGLDLGLDDTGAETNLASSLFVPSAPDGGESPDYNPDTDSDYDEDSV
ncbi:hypothetical protein LZ554_009327 [Drepanopeziza brunnea f. sp. 'monogermtubi']|nr:hypothetical protein LZ554_009327 [Drepanopeziza brunnea f. sp. 'monogermtubi']